MSHVIHTGRNLDVLPTLPDNSIDAIVTDPPYGLEFMGNEWDAPWKQGGAGFSKPGIGNRQTSWPSFTSTSRFGSSNPTCAKCGGRLRGSKKCGCEQPEWKPIGKRRNPENEGLPNDVTSFGISSQMQAFQDWFNSVAVEMFRVLKPGGHILSFGGSRTYHRMACAIEDAGFEVRDQLMWVYGSGFPKSHNISKALDKAAGVEPKVLGRNPNSRENSKQDDNLYEAGTVGKTAHLTAPSSKEAKEWEGWGTALKPAHEPICLARKPLDGTVADNVLKWGVGGLNIDGCRVANNGEQFGELPNWGGGKQISKEGLSFAEISHDYKDNGNAEAVEKLKSLGRFPANLMHDGSQEVLELFPQSNGGAAPKKANDIKTLYDGGWKGVNREERIEYGKGSAARFFYCPKASKSDRDEGCEGLPDKEWKTEGACIPERGDRPFNPSKNNHPTVKPTELMRYLCRLITPPGGTVLDPFNGSGSTGKAAILEGFNYIGIEMNPEYVAISEARIKAALER